MSRRASHLSKSNFVRGYHCSVRLAHAANGLPSKFKGDDFLRMLAEGGFQFEKLVRHAFPGPEVRGDIRQPLLAHEETLRRVKELLATGGGVLHEATFCHGGLAARVDMLRVKPGQLEVCEIKAKSFDGPVDPARCGEVQSDRGTIIGARGGVGSNWVRYVADVAFQVMVVERVLQASMLMNVSVLPRLIVANRNAMCGADEAFGNMTIDAARILESGRMTSEDVRWVCEPPAGYRSPMILEVDVSESVRLLRTKDGKSRAALWRGEALDLIVDQAEGIFLGSMQAHPGDERGLRCRDCEFRVPSKQGEQTGFAVCWGDSVEAASALLGLYYGHEYVASGGAAAGASRGPKATGSDWVALTIGSSHPENFSIADLELDSGAGARAQTRNLQIMAERTRRVRVSDDFAAVVRSTLLCDGRPGVLHFIDFETSMACLPLVPGLHPYEVIAFQFSVHSADSDGSQIDPSLVRHREYLNTADSSPGSVLDDDRAFIDALEASLGTDASPVFHWADHERTVLRLIRRRLAGSGTPADSGRLTFIDGLVGPNGDAGRLVNMLREVAEGRIMAPGQEGRYSMKTLLPAICRDADVRALLACVMGSDLSGDFMSSEANPYDLLPAMPWNARGAGVEAAESVAEDDGAGSVACGTDAMRAFQQLRFGSVARWQQVDRSALVEAMLRYCKLDTAAMVAVWWWMVKEAGRATSGAPG
jgi:hypothetical protein